MANFIKQVAQTDTMFMCGNQECGVRINQDDCYYQDSVSPHYVICASCYEDMLSLYATTPNE